MHPRNLPATLCALRRSFSSKAETFLDRFVNHEAAGVPKGAGTAGADGFDLGRMHALLAALGQPQRELRVAHITGTKGKGSTASMLSAILRSASYRVGTYTSPHLVSLTERLAVDAEPIAPAALDALTDSYGAAITDVHRRLPALSHFEVLSGLALRHFADQKVSRHWQVDVAVIEAGLGGERDATNVFTADELRVAVFTAVGMEHAAALGGTLESIARAKAGIMRRGVPAVIGRQPEPLAEEILHAAAAERGCERFNDQAIIRHRSFRLDIELGLLRETVGMFLMNGECDSERGLELQLVGRPQRRNAETAATAALVLRRRGFPRVTVDAIAAGLSAARLPGRFQVERLRQADGSAGPWLVLDGAHTPAAASGLAATLRAVFPDAPLAVVIAMAADKDAAGVMAALRTARPDVVVFTSAAIAGSSVRSTASGQLLAQWQAANMQATDRVLRSRELVSPSVASAVERAKQQMLSHGADAVICVTGSLHAVASALSSGAASKQ